MLRKHPFIFMFSLVLILFMGFAWFAYTIVEGGVITNALSSVKKQIEPQESAFEKRPKDSDLKNAFLKNHATFIKLKEMFEEDKLSYLDKSYIIHEEDYKHSTFFPYAFGEVPKNARMSKKRFEEFMSLMKQCGATKISSCDAGRDESKKSDKDDDDEDDDDSKGKASSEAKPYSADGIKFHMFDERDSESGGVWNKYIVCWKLDDFICIPDTDQAKKDKNGEINEQTRLEAHWYIWKYQSQSSGKRSK